MLNGVRLARKIAAQPALADWVARELAPGPDAQSDDELLDYIHKTHNTVYHPACTARMGADGDPTRCSTRSCPCAASRACAWPTARRCRSCRPSTPASRR